MAALASIKNPVWGISTVGYGAIVEGIASLRQCIDVIIRTTKGTDPLRSEFGSNVFKYIDMPLNIAIPNIKREILDALDVWEQRIKVVGINHYVDTPGNPIFEITYRVIDENVVDKLVLDLQQGTIVSDALNEIILQAFFPPNPNNYRYQVKLFKNGNQVFPLPNKSGYATIQELFTWIQSNWFFLGRWYLLNDKIICYLSSDGVKNATLSIEVLPIVQFAVDFPQLAPGEKYQVSFKANGVNATPEMPLTFFVPGQVLAWVQINWSDYADWSIEFMQPTGNATFNDEFSNEFDVPGTGYRLIGISSVEGFTGELSITNVS